MGTESNKKPLLTLNDPVDGPTVKRIGELQTRSVQLSQMLLDYEREKVKILVEDRRVEDERARLFSQILTARGLSPNVAVDIDAESGRIQLLQTNGQAAPVAPPAPPQPAAEPQQA